MARNHLAVISDEAFLRISIVKVKLGLTAPQAVDLILYLSGLDTVDVSTDLKANEKVRQALRALKVEV